MLLYLDMGKDAWRFTWDSATGEPKEDCKLEIWSSRSSTGVPTSSWDLGYKVDERLERCQLRASSGTGSRAC